MALRRTAFLMPYDLVGLLHACNHTDTRRLLACVAVSKRDVTTTVCIVHVARTFHVCEAEQQAGDSWA